MQYSINPNFWDDVEKKLDNILYGDTDSIFLGIKEIVPKDTKEAVTEAEKVSNEINNVLADYKDNYLLPKLNIDPQYNKTDFKNELTAESIFFLDVKKNYAFKQTSKEGKILDPPEFEYTGIPIVKTDAAKYSQDLLRTLIEEIVLSNIQNKKEKLKDTLKHFYEKLQSEIQDYKFDYIGIPTKWGITNYKKEPTGIVSMRLYNTIVENIVFKPSTSGWRFPIKLNNIQILNERIDKLRNTNEYFLRDEKSSVFNFLCIPYNYDKNKLKEKMEELDIAVDFEEFNNKLFIKTVERIIQIIKENYVD